jgi:hypothetical protein
MKFLRRSRCWKETDSHAGTVSRWPAKLNNDGSWHLWSMELGDLLDDLLHSHRVEVNPLLFTSCADIHQLILRFVQRSHSRTPGGYRCNELGQ